MALGNGNSLGISAKIEPTADKGSTDKMVRDLEKDIKQVEKLQFESDGFEGRTSPGGGKGGGMGATGAAGAGGLASKLGGGAAAAGAAMIGTVALGGVLAERMYRSLSASSGRLQATNSMLGKAWDMTLKPLGDLVGSALQPYAKGALKTLVKLNQIFSEDGISVDGLERMGDLITDIPGGIANAFMESGFNQIELLVGEKFEPSDLFSGGQIGAKEVLSFLQFPGITTQAFLDEFGWPQIGVGQFLGMTTWPTIATAAFLDPVTFPTIAAGSLLSQIDWPSITKGAIMDEVFGGGSNDSDTDTTTSTTSGSSPQNTLREREKSGDTNPFTPRNDGGGNSGFDPDVNPFKEGNQDINIDIDGRRIYNSTKRKADDLLDRI